MNQVFRKRTTLLEKLEYRFLDENTTRKTQHFHIKLPCQKPMLIQTEWGLKYRPVTKSTILLQV